LYVQGEICGGAVWKRKKKKWQGGTIEEKKVDTSRHVLLKRVARVTKRGKNKEKQSNNKKGSGKERGPPQGAGGGGGGGGRLGGWGGCGRGYEKASGRSSPKSKETREKAINEAVLGLTWPGENPKRPS